VHIKGICRHLYLILLPGPFNSGPVDVQLNTVAIGVAEIDCLADAVVGKATKLSLIV
jgi:hypothetical protein